MEMDISISTVIIKVVILRLSVKTLLVASAWSSAQTSVCKNRNLWAPVIGKPEGVEAATAGSEFQMLPQNFSMPFTSIPLGFQFWFLQFFLFFF